MKNSKAKGDVSEGFVIAQLLKLGYALSIPFGDNQRYDLIVDDGERLWRAQVKTARLRDGCLVFNTTSQNVLTGARRGYRGEIDLFLAYSPDTERVYCVLIEAAGATEMWLRVDPPAYEARRRTAKWARDYELVGQAGFEPAADSRDIGSALSPD